MPQHTPTYSITGYTATFDADVVEIAPVPLNLAEGVRIDNTLFAATSATGNIAFTLLPETDYAIRMLGRPEDPSVPNRLTVNEVINIPLTDEDKLQRAWDGVRDAFVTFMALNPNFDRMAAALEQPEK